MVDTQAVRFIAVGSVTLDASGGGYVRMAPAGYKWQVDRVTVTTSTNVLEAQARVYQDGMGSINIADAGTYAGSSGDTSDTVHYLEDGQALYIVWTGGDVGALATVTIAGWRSQMMGGFRAVH